MKFGIRQIIVMIVKKIWLNIGSVLEHILDIMDIVLLLVIE